MFGLEKRRWEELRAGPFPAEWLSILERNVPFFTRLPEADRGELQGHIQVLLAEKSWEGCGGVELTDEMRVTIAAHAALLLLHLPEVNYYPKLSTILVYPHAYQAPHSEVVEGGIVVEGPQGRLGESWHSGVVVLSWDSVRRGARDLRDGHNVALHEFAHQLDQEDGAADGTPELESREDYRAWARVLGEEYLELQRDAEQGHKTVLDDYGATHPAEFFAVATETFFEKPHQLRAKHPELYEELKLYFQQDPAEEWEAGGRKRESESTAAEHD